MRQGVHELKFRTIEDEKRILKRYAQKNQQLPFHGTFPGPEIGRANALHAAEKFKRLVMLVTAAQRRKVWRQLKKDLEEQRHHLRVA